MRLSLTQILNNIHRRGITDPAVINAVSKVPRACFVRSDLRALAERDAPLPIGQGQTISQPSLVAFMTAELHIDARSRVLEIGTGCGYQTAILAEIAKDVFTIEVRRELSKEAQERLTRLGYHGIYFKVGDGTLGWPEMAPFDAIVVTAAAHEVPQALVDQLCVGGRLVLPLDTDDDTQELCVVTKTEREPEIQRLFPVRFVPIVPELEVTR
jgi:protein-L-isoaspartate(D-aspartate) O-methyltransferase